LAEYAIKIYNGQSIETQIDLHASNLSPHLPACMEAIQRLLQQSLDNLHILELGAGVGLTGLKVATELKCNVALTDLPVAMSLLEQNIDLNRHQFRNGPDAVFAAPLPWGQNAFEDGTLQKVISKLFHQSSNKSALETDLSTSHKPIMILASDCVYYEELHEPLEETLAAILSTAHPDSICLIAGMRRWKRDNTFYKKLGRRTRTSLGTLDCTCIYEKVERVESREILRVFCIRWILS